eukprot:CAMPEP_0205825416 /NCGR_PEP_ID=MMETSP0206-20130828/25107_1 /ASSEMBLY_ACC=CAM_ASM_000279 /TAXON_ID=36767 /ORGANISM="Euplotes focardii, Strain TN1" /LENGTH=33 /DNA_ID= /DNA_START= /DNA_END= /DNA_ORIENTATION=
MSSSLSGPIAPIAARRKQAEHIGLVAIFSGKFF